MVKRVLVIGLDSAPLELLNPWLNAGKLPNLKRIFSNGAVGVLRSTFPPLSPAAWSSFSTGMYPGKHGVYDHGYRQSEEYRIVPTDARRRAGTPVWDIISEKGGIVGVINVPETYPPRRLNGFLITGMTTPSDDADWCYPPTLAQELEYAIGGYKVFGTRSKENLDKSLAGMKKTIPMRMRAGAYLWKKYDPQFMVLVFMETDVVQHKTWKYMDVTHPQYDPIGAREYGNSILDVYRRVDENLPLLLDQLDSETTVIIMSDHGAGPIDKWLNLNVWLLRNKYLHLKSSIPSRLRKIAFNFGWTPNHAYKMAASLRLGVIDMAANRIKRQASRDRSVSPMGIFLSFADVDWKRTRAYTLGGNLNGIWVNLRGREPEGCVSPGKEYEQVREVLIDNLKDLRDPDTGDAIVTAVHRREEVYQGPYVNRAPDLVFETIDEKYTGFGVQEFPTNQIMAPSPLFSGTHRQRGMVILQGEPIRRGVQLGEHSIVDLAPTILHLLGYEVPRDMDGKVISEALSKSFQDENPISYSGNVWKPSLDESAGFSEKERKGVTERLRDLGYL